MAKKIIYYYKCPKCNARIKPIKPRYHTLSAMRNNRKNVVNRARNGELNQIIRIMNDLITTRHYEEAFKELKSQLYKRKKERIVV